MSAVSVPVVLDAVPAELRPLDRWVVWRLEERDGKATKVPHRGADPATRASSTEPKTWSSFDMAVVALEAGKADGIGLVLGDGLVGVDLDSVLDETGEIRADFPVEGIGGWLVALNGYVEVSPSGRGLHVVGRGELPSWSRNRRDGVEVYSRDRYLTITGRVFEGLGRFGELQHLPEFLEAAGLRKPEPLNGSHSPAVPVDLGDRELIEKAIGAKNGAKFERLWNGDTSAHGDDDSVADLALCSLLAYWTGRDPDRIDSMFRSSGLYREKWERQDYRERTIGKAIEGCRDVYSVGAENAPRPRPSTSSRPRPDTTSSLVPPPSRGDEVEVFVPDLVPTSSSAGPRAPRASVESADAKEGDTAAVETETKSPTPFAGYSHDEVLRLEFPAERYLVEGMIPAARSERSRVSPRRTRAG
ncbi:MAG: hypothetical protein WKF65_07690 [Gaiellaceae bacterium]